MRILRFLALLLAVLPVQAFAMSSGPLTIETADGRKLAFTVELAATPHDLAQGLMNRPSLPADAGMLFDFGEVRPASMWMKNTLIPLDMVFIGADGRIVSIAERTVPLSLEVISSPEPVKAVLEVNGGTADRLKIHPGDRVRHPLFKS